MPIPFLPEHAVKVVVSNFEVKLGLLHEMHVIHSNIKGISHAHFPLFMMQTVITWRRPRDFDRNLHYGNPCLFLIGNALCYIISGLIVLVVGVIITSLTFQNLEHHDSETSERYAGPILIVVGVLVLARGAINRIRPGDSTTPQRLVIRSYTGEISTRPIMEFSSNSMTMCSVSIAETHEYPRLSIYNDDPPSYDAVVDAVVDPARVSESTTTLDESTQSPDEQQELPPSYEECLETARSTPTNPIILPQEVIRNSDT